MQRPELLAEPVEVIVTEFACQARVAGLDREAATYELRRDLLRCCREDGIDRGISRWFTAGLPQLVQLLNRPAQPQEMPQRIESLRQVLALVSRNERPDLWAELQVALGSELIESPLGNRAENLEEAIAAFRASLDVYTRATFPEQWARTQNNLGFAYLERMRGGRTDNLEAALRAYQDALQVYTRDTFPQQWAWVQNNLGAVYCERRRGGRTDNLEAALRAYQDALQVYTRDAFPQQWAVTQFNLGEIYRNRIRGDRADNLERALGAFQDALEVLTPDTSPERWAAARNNFGEVCRERIRGDRADNLEQALRAYQDALQFYTRDASPVWWARIRGNVGAAYRYRIRGDRAENLEQALRAYEDALQVLTRDAFRVDWAKIQNNLGDAYRNRLRGRDADNLEAAIRALTDALQVFTREAFPEEWAAAKSNLGSAFRDRIRGERAENLEAALRAYQDALGVRTREAWPVEWAMTLNNLGNAYCARIRGDRAENLEAAIHAYQGALRVYTRESFPEQWATTQNNLGVAYRDRAKGDRADNLDAAIRAHADALQVFTREAFPAEWVVTQNNLGVSYGERIGGDRVQNRRQAADCWQAVLNHLQDAFLDAAEGRPITREIVTSTRRLARLYREDGHYRDVVTVLEQGKAVGLRQELLRVDPPEGLAPAEQQQYQSLIRQLREVRSERRQLEQRNLPPLDYGTQLSELARRLESATEKLHELEARAPSGKFRPPRYADLCQAARDHNLVIVYFHVTDDPQGRAEAYLIHARSSPQDEPPPDDIVPGPAVSRAVLLRLLSAGPEGVPFAFDQWAELLTAGRQGTLGWMAAYWLTALARETGDETKIEEAQQVWQQTVRAVLDELGKGLAVPLALRLERLGQRRVVFLPEGLLALFPLHAAPLPGTDQDARHLGDQFVISYAPSATSLLRCLLLAGEHGRSPEPTVTAIANPDGSLAFAAVQADAVARHFPGRARVAQGSRASLLWLLQNTPEADFLELATHAFYYLGQPFNSSLLLAHPQGHTVPRWLEAGGSLSTLQAECERLTLNDVWSWKLNLKRGCVVCASACETGQVEPTARDEEYRGFPAAFLACGASAVFATLWAVDDLCTAWLMELTYERMRAPKPLRPAEALQEAIQCLRRLSRDEVRGRVQMMIQGLEQQRLAGGWKVLSQEQVDARSYLLRVLKARWLAVDEGPAQPFEHPSFWAAFAVHGA
jgi:CHAT domain-containing protein